MILKSEVTTELIDPTCVADTFVEGIGEIERIGANCIRITLFASRSIGQGIRERIVVARLVLPEPAFTRCLRQCTAFSTGEIAFDENEAIEGACH
jgi:hypothetical protein